MKCSVEQVLGANRGFVFNCPRFLTRSSFLEILTTRLFSGWGGRVRSLSMSGLEADHQVLAAVARRRPSRRVGVAMVNEGKCEVHGSEC
jgi:hypothetical protein